MARKAPPRGPCIYAFTVAVLVFVCMAARSASARAAPPVEPGREPWQRAVPQAGSALENGWDRGFVFPVHAPRTEPLDKSLPLPEVLRELSRPRGYVSPESVVNTGPFPLPYNDFVQAYIDYYSGEARRDFAKWLMRSGMYRDMVKARLRERGMPEELFHLAMIESGFRLKARSRAGAKGMWQFMRATGENFGLAVNYWADERCDPEKSTEAALDYLGYLYERFGDWHLAAAAYNAGEGKVARGLRYTGCEDYWCLCDKRVIRLETRAYLPKIIAAAMISNRPEAYGFHNIERMEALAYEDVPVHGAVDLRLLADCAGVTVSGLKSINPELMRFCTPPGGEYTLHIPPGKSARFRKAYAKLSPKDRDAFKKHTVKEGECLGTVAAGYGVSKWMLAYMNGMSPHGWLKQGQVLTVPAPRDAAYNPPTTPAPGRRVAYRKGSGNALFYIAKPGDTLWEIAMIFGVSVADLAEWNRIPDPATLRPGRELVIYAEQRREPYSGIGPGEELKSPAPACTCERRTAFHRVEKGESLWKIAREYGAGVEEVMECNGLVSEMVKPGQVLTVCIDQGRGTRGAPHGYITSGN